MRTAMESGSADLCVGMQSSRSPWTLSAGEPYAAPSSTPGSASAISRTVSKVIFFRRICLRTGLLLFSPPACTAQDPAGLGARHLALFICKRPVDEHVRDSFRDLGGFLESRFVTDSGAVENSDVREVSGDQEPAPG